MPKSADCSAGNHAGCNGYTNMVNVKCVCGCHPKPGDSHDCEGAGCECGA